MNRQAKKTVLTIAIIGIVALFLLIRYQVCNLYTQECKIITNMCGWYMVEDKDGNLWEFGDKENFYNLGEKVIVTFDNMDTNYLYDDEIKKVERLDEKG